MAPLERSVLATLTYFDMFDYPLTLAEVARFRYAIDEDGMAPAKYSELAVSLAAVGAGERDGYWHLSGRGTIVDTRLRRYRLAGPKFRRAQRAARVIGMLPSVRFVAVCNSLALSNADTESDIDMFVIVKHGTLWITRLIIVSVLKLLRLRPTTESHADKFCLSFFVSERDLDLSRVAIGGGDDPYLRYWVASLVPLYDDGIGERFYAENTWIRSVLPGWRRESPARCHGTTPGVGILRAFDGAARRIQERAFPDVIRTRANADTDVVIDGGMLKFHVNDRRAEFAAMFRERLSRQGSTML